MLFFVRGFGDLLLLSSVALAPALVRSLVQLWRLSWRVASSRGGGRVLLLVPSGCRFVLQLFGHLAHVRLPFACATMHSAVSWTRAGPGCVSRFSVFAPAHVPVAARPIEVHLSSAR